MKSLKEAEKEPYILAVTRPCDVASSVRWLCPHRCPSVRQMHCSISFFQQWFSYTDTRGRYPTSQMISHKTANTSLTLDQLQAHWRCLNSHIKRHFVSFLDSFLDTYRRKKHAKSLAAITVQSTKMPPPDTPRVPCRHITLLLCYVMVTVFLSACAWPGWAQEEKGTPKEAEGYKVLVGMDSAASTVRGAPDTENCWENEEQNMSRFIFQ